ncbi:uncharacterized protein LOC142241299 [Haematobia irritans]|uniref:FMRFamide related propeptide n=1 Tax=Haematobia irritans TaxID=7368 RepID=UPI003F5079E9
MTAFLFLLLAFQLCHTATVANSITNLPPQYDDDPLHTDFFPNHNNELANELGDIASDGDMENNAAERGDNFPVIQSVDDETEELQFPKPIQWVTLNNLRNAILLKFQNPKQTKINNKLDPEEIKRLRSLQENIIRWGKRSYENYPVSRNEFGNSGATRMDYHHSHQVVRDSRGDNFMRFGRSVGNNGNGDDNFMRFGRASGGNNDFMRFGRAANQDFMRFGRGNQDNFMRFGRAPGHDFMRFGRAAAGQDFMRFGRAAAGQDFMRFGRTATGQQDFMRFGRTPSSKDFMRFGRTPSAQDFMRFGRAPSPQDFMRFGRSSPSDLQKGYFDRYSRPDNFMRFGRTPLQNSDFMRFGKSLSKSENNTVSNQLKQQLGKSELKQAVKLIHEADKNADNENPVDKAMKVLFDKHEQQSNDQMQHFDNDDEQSADSTQHEGPSDDQNTELDYFFKMTN